MVKRCNDSKFVCGYKHILRLGCVGGKGEEEKGKKGLLYTLDDSKYQITIIQQNRCQMETFNAHERLS